MHAATALGVATIAALASFTTSAEAGRVRVSQEMTGGAGDFTTNGFIKTYDRSQMSAAAVYNYGGLCQSSYSGTTFQPARNATVMAVIDTIEGRTLFTVHNFPCPEPGEPTGTGGTAAMSFLLKHDDDDSMECLVRDDPTVDRILCNGTEATTDNLWLPEFTDGFVLGPLGGAWQLDASFRARPTGTLEVIVRSDGGGDISRLSTERAIRLDNAVEVGVDVQPGANVGCLNIDGNGVIPVAILGAADFDVREVDTSTLAFAGMQVRVRGNGEHQCAIEHVNTDGHPDLACKFFDDPDAWTPGNATAAVSGELVDSTPIYGEDSICVGPPS